jgi:hypothetical protein
MSQPESQETEGGAPSESSSKTRTTGKIEDKIAVVT